MTLTKSARGSAPKIAPLSISQAAIWLGVSHRALRHYESLGLVEPSRPKRNTRAYDTLAIQRLELIVALRAADLPLGVVADILNREGDPLAQERRVVSVIESALERARRAVDRLETVRQAALEDGLSGLRRLAGGSEQAALR